ncbi:OmpA family protein [Pseudomonas lalucatii]|uniref:OmpA family protein n=1 Tax=Pseudomonas lalucatii TaxID=1424203 RepID=A0ABS5PY63_9PSED|nr:OmpA family protein [Pseudomonas lalucatii]MBS7661420.1 OmpA family protein [Pseudomonas lalucatii]MBS7724096.1 OmpA family protein [Pseudomonas lalucatii]QVM87901.1 OmpA family protein [Pseudomonas lalucatii]
MFAKKNLALALCLLMAGCAGSENKPQAQAVVMPAPLVSQAWLDDYEPRLREAIKGSHFELERRDNLLVVTAPVQGSFNPDRPHMLLPITLGPISRVAKLVEHDKNVAVLVLGHADSSGAAASNRELSHERARAFTAIFRLSGLRQDRLLVKGLGSDMPRADNGSAAGRALNRRVEILLTRQDSLKALLAQYSQPAAIPAVAQASPAAKTAKSKPVTGKQVVAAEQAN